MSPGLGDHSVFSINQDNGEVGSRSAGNHVAGVLLVPGRVGNNKFTFGGRKIAVCHVDCNPLFPFGF